MPIDYPRRAPTGTWYIHLEDVITFADVDGGVENTDLGSSASVDLLFHPAPADEGLPYRYRDRYQRLREHCEFAGRTLIKQPPFGPEKFVEQTPPGAPSLLVGLEPSYEHPETAGIWGVIDGYSSSNQHQQAYLMLSLEITVIATMEEYIDRESVRTDLELAGRAL
ncbi:hypothetical protein [Natrinema soli]|uniref:Uncharacterized protein n=1 Tax=Natrinema soli TaxID=1930624 RepID=A0ABD5SL41_9EURY|nr:hypothetical protein [Natrinema soli]